MGTILAMSLPAAPARIGRMLRFLGHALRDLGHAIKQHLGNRYRPEQHYMRGPGPKWQERNGAAPACEARHAAGEPAGRRAGEAQRPGLSKQSRRGRR
jgi:hypothetical protein